MRDKVLNCSVTKVKDEAQKLSLLMADLRIWIHQERGGRAA